MGAYSDFLQNLVRLMRENGLDADVEYPQRLVSADENAVFCLIGLKTVRTDAAFPCDGGLAAPVTLDVRFRLHGAPSKGTPFLVNCFEQTVIGALLDYAYDLRTVAIDGAAYDKRIGRLVLDAVCSIHGTFDRINHTEGGDENGVPSLP